MATASNAFKAACVLKEKYLTSTTIVLNEVVKLVFAMTMVLIGFRITRAVKLREMPRHLASILFCKECLLMAVPGLLYFIMNQLAFVALENLEASTYGLVSQLKILTTAVFARLMLNKKLFWYQWRALLLLVVGVILVQQVPPPKPLAIIPGPPPALPPANNLQLEVPTATDLPELPPVTPSVDSNILIVGPSDAAADSTGRASRHLLMQALSTQGKTASVQYPSASNIKSPVTFDPIGTSSSDDKSVTTTSTDATTSTGKSSDKSQKSAFAQSKGVIAAITAAVLSGLSGCYVEKMMKGGTLTVWDRNIQLAVYGILFGMAQIILMSSDDDRKYAAENGWLGGYTIVAWLVVFLNSCGGILVSLIVVYLDNIIRGFATSVSILLTAFVSWAVFHDVEITVVFVCGVTTVLISVANYQDTMIAAPDANAGVKESPSPVAAGTAPSASPRASTKEPIELSGVSVHRFSDADQKDVPPQVVVSGNTTGTMPRSRSQMLSPMPSDEENESASLLGRPSK